MGVRFLSDIKPGVLGVRFLSDIKLGASQQNQES